MHLLETVTILPRPRQEVFPFFADAANLGRITPPELGFSILTPQPIAMAEGTLIDYRIGLWGLPMRWRTRICRWEPGIRFADEQLRGPYRTWHHTHLFEDTAEGGTRMTDQVLFELPLEPLSRVALPLIKLQLRRIFGYRHRALTKAFALPERQAVPEISIVAHRT